MIRILLADDHEIVRRGLREVLETHPDWEVCAEAENGREAVERAREHRPDVAVLDLSLPELNGLEVTRRIRRESPNTEVLVFTVHDSEELVFEALSVGARGYVLKSDGASNLIDAVEALSIHRPFFNPEVMQTIVQGYVRDRGESPAGQSAANELTPRERQVIQLLAEGRGNQEIAELLHISVKTVETHRAAIMRKFGFRSIVDLVRYAIREGIATA
ncbi:MAG TPA: response regulator transcription factor [Thermomicrobiales bacterium]|nr:response regulator transcription factor [Thermomicrobiales bacterium]